MKINATFSLLNKKEKSQFFLFFSNDNQLYTGDIEYWNTNTFISILSKIIITPFFEFFFSAKH